MRWPHQGRELEMIKDLLGPHYRRNQLLSATNQLSVINCRCYSGYKHFPVGPFAGTIGMGHWDIRI